MEPSNKGLLTAKEKKKAFANYPCLDPTFEDDYLSEVATLLQAQREKTLREVKRGLALLSPLCPNRSICLDKIKDAKI